MSDTKLTTNELVVLRWIDRYGIEPPPALPVGELSRIYDWLLNAGYAQPRTRGQSITETGRKALRQDVEI